MNQSMGGGNSRKKMAGMKRNADTGSETVCGRVVKHGDKVCMGIEV